ncbi:MAG TPA: cation-efflux pump [Candidatus Bathyarchaeia archaeon]|nr:cation-efflux pump [Candidatus Bathyarchaeia archaeon]
MAAEQNGNRRLRALRLSAFAIASVVFVEISLGIAVSSLAIVSDGLHALLDALTTVVLFVATKAALKPPDEEHMYGHEKFENIGGLIGGIVLIGVALLVIYEAVAKLLGGGSVNEGLQLVGFAAIGFTLCIDVFRIGVFRGASVDSATAKVGFYHAIADLSSTLIALLGFGLAALAGIIWGDAFASIALGLLLSVLSVRLVKNSVMELSDTASANVSRQVRRIITSEEGVTKSENLRCRKVGSKTFVEASIQVPEFMSLDEAHALASRIEGKLSQALGNVDATIHIEPSQKEATMEKLVEKLASVEGVREVHEIATVYASGKLYITLHAIVDPNLSVEEAHNIAEKIEKQVHTGIKLLEHVTVHVEPSGEIRAIEIGEDELKKIISKVTDGVSENLRLEKVLTYVAGGKRYINLDCCFTKQITIAEAHELASRIEKEIKERFAEAVVTVHIEPICT